MALPTDGFNWSIQNVDDFVARLDKLAQATNDFRVPFRLISSDFYRSQRQLFSLQSAGLYTDLSTKPFRALWRNKKEYGFLYEGGYKEYKLINTGFVYPILVGKSRDLSNSTLGKDHRYSVYFLGKQELNIGSRVPYGKYHQSDAPRNKIPLRKFIFIDGGAGDKSKGSGINGRRDRWLSIIDEHIKQLLEGVA
jgi:hypothetical protein